MAALKISESDSTHLVLNTSLSTRIGSIGTLFAFSCIFCICLSALSEGRIEDNPILLVGAFFLLFLGLRALYSVFATTIVTVDLASRVATNQTSFFGIPLRRVEL